VAWNFELRRRWRNRRPAIVPLRHFLSECKRRLRDETLPPGRAHLGGSSARQLRARTYAAAILEEPEARCGEGVKRQERSHRAEFVQRLRAPGLHGRQSRQPQIAHSGIWQSSPASEGDLPRVKLCYGSSSSPKGTRTDRTVPSPGRVLRSRLPPASRARSCILINPKPPRPRASTRENPSPVSWMRNCSSLPSYESATLTGAPGACLAACGAFPAQSGTKRWRNQGY